jgi:hypothetical protein
MPAVKPGTYCVPMDGDSITAQPGPAAVAAFLFRFALTVGLAVTGVVVVVALAGREAGEPPATASGRATQAASVSAAPISDFRLSGKFAPQAYFLIVASEEARMDLTRALSQESLVREILQEPARVTWVVAVGSDAEAEAVAEAVAGDASIPTEGGITSIQVLDLR